MGRNEPGLERLISEASDREAAALDAFATLSFGVFVGTRDLERALVSALQNNHQLKTSMQMDSAVASFLRMSPRRPITNFSQFVLVYNHLVDWFLDEVESSSSTKGRRRVAFAESPKQDNESSSSLSSPANRQSVARHSVTRQSVASRQSYTAQARASQVSRDSMNVVFASDAMPVVEAEMGRVVRQRLSQVSTGPLPRRSERTLAAQGLSLPGFEGSEKHRKLMSTSEKVDFTQSSSLEQSRRLVRRISSQQLLKPGLLRSSTMPLALVAEVAETNRSSTESAPEEHSGRALSLRRSASAATGEASEDTLSNLSESSGRATARKQFRSRRLTKDEDSMKASLLEAGVTDRNSSPANLPSGERDRNSSPASLQPVQTPLPPLCRDKSPSPTSAWREPPSEPPPAPAELGELGELGALLGAEAEAGTAAAAAPPVEMAEAVAEPPLAQKTVLPPLATKPKWTGPARAADGDEAEAAADVGERAFKPQPGQGRCRKSFAISTEFEGSRVSGLPMDIVGTFSCHGTEPKEEEGAVAKINQDCACVCYPALGNPSNALFCVYDGHGDNGHVVSQEVLHAMIHHLEDNAEELEEDPSATLANAFESVQEHLILMNEQEELEVDSHDSGACANCVLLRQRQLFVANAGDCRAVLGTRDESCAGDAGGGLIAIGLSTDHKVDLPSEQARLEASGAWVRPSLDDGSMPARVYESKTAPRKGPGLTISRALGDCRARKCNVVPTPEVIWHNLQPEDEYLIIASDGVFEFLSNEQVVQIVDALAKQGKSAEDACKMLIAQAGVRWRMFEGDYRDDITAIVVYLQPVVQVLEQATATGGS